MSVLFFFFFQAEDGIRDRSPSRGLGDVYKRQLNGSVELAPIVGLSEVIVDIVETGSTLKENGLEVLEEICPLSARVVVNEVSMKMQHERITKLLKDLKKVIPE